MNAEKNGRIRVLLSLLCVALSGCGGVFGNGQSDFERQQKSQQNSTETLAKKGAKFEKRSYPQGEAWAVDLSDMQITDETFALLKQSGYLSELNLSGSSITDAQLAKLDGDNMTAFVLKLDLSRTAITDAGIGGIKNFTLLRELKLTGTKVTAAGIEAYKKNRQSHPLAPKEVAIIQ